jgi:hypothetical protein
MALVQGQCACFKQNLLSGLENFAAGTPYTYKIALYNGLATLNAQTTAYTNANEVVGTGYTAGGQVLTISQVPTTTSTDSSGTSFISFNNVTWSPAAFTARGALIYNATTGAAVLVLDFGSDKTASNSFTVQFPPATATSAVTGFN